MPEKKSNSRHKNALRQGLENDLSFLRLLLENYSDFILRICNVAYHAWIQWELWTHTAKKIAPFVLFLIHIFAPNHLVILLDFFGLSTETLNKKWQKKAHVKGEIFLSLLRKLRISRVWALRTKKILYKKWTWQNCASFGVGLSFLA